jgi:hypothetical protein
MSKELLKIRKQWLISPESKIHQPKNKQKTQRSDSDLRRFVGNVSDLDLDEMDDLEEEK